MIGGKDIIPSLIELYAKYQSNNNYRSTIFFTINSLGMTGDSSLVPLFERLLTNYNNHNIQVPQAVIANALYLLTGRCDYYYIDESKTKHKLNITENQVLARKIILNSRGRRRSFDEMMELEFLFRPPDWRHEMEVFDIFKAKQRRLSNYE